MDALKIKIKSDGTPHGTTIIDTESGKHLLCTALKIEFKAGRIVTTLEMEDVEIEIEGGVTLKKETVRRYQSVPGDRPSVRKAMAEARRQIDPRDNWPFVGTEMCGYPGPVTQPDATRDRESGQGGSD